ncbi:Hypothetical predicted protein [Octopus vulgaris]|uniref:Uncharacterized protein n=1 Tax=Octopus vulgaris TaxID=6645 RepID=A0AA36F5A2_OCTVU|nr:Hypothetical predicted protein [Octopus vulgaris]
MSRRKQSHPKPIKRLPGDENIDKELEDELDRKNLEDIKEEVLPTPAQISNHEDMESNFREEECEILRLVKGAGDDLQVCCTIPLPKNSCLGPFCGDIASNEESCDTLLEVLTKKDRKRSVWILIIWYPKLKNLILVQSLDLLFQNP